MQCTYNVAVKSVLATIVAVEKRCVTYSEYVFVTLVIQHEMRMLHIVICGLFDSTKFFPIMS